MKKYVLPSLKLTVILILICGVIYPLLIAAIGLMAPGKGQGVTVELNGRVVGYETIGQLFTQDTWFQGRPSATLYNAAGSGGSNKGPSNAVYLSVVRSRIDTFLVHNPGVNKREIPGDLVTASGSGLDPHISVEAALIQVPRIARLRNIREEELMTLVRDHIEPPLFGIFGTEKINVLKLNIALSKQLAKKS